MAKVSLSDVNLWIAPMMESLAIKDYKVNVLGHTENGDGFSGIITFIHISCKMNGKITKDYQLIIKSAKDNEELRQKIPIQDAYDTELHVYSTILPAFRKFQLETGSKNVFNKYAKCYSVTEQVGKEALILDNMKSLGFDMHDKLECMDMAHVALVLQNYAHWHAVSLAMRRQKPKMFETLTSKLTNPFAKIMIKCQFYEPIIDTFITSMQLWPDVSNLCENFQKTKLEDELTKLLIDSPQIDENTSVVVHGDCWNNNFMFKYEGNKPVDVVLLDFQLSRLSSPMLDLSYFLYSNCDENVLDHLDEVLRNYHNHLMHYLGQMGCNGEEIFPIETLQSQWHLQGKFGLYVAPYFLKVVYCDKNDIPQMEEIVLVNKDGDVQKPFEVKVGYPEKYNRRVHSLLTHFVKKWL